MREDISYYFFVESFSVIVTVVIIWLTEYVSKPTANMHIEKKNEEEEEEE
jgi:p-aminobenzoyl-glutamate transporter AbgT